MINSIEIRCRPENNTLIPHSTGHLLYSAALSSIRKTNPELSEKIHGSENAEMTVSPLNGEFDRKDRNRKRVFSDTEYSFFINLIDSEGFQELFNDLILKGQKLDIAGESFEITGMNTEEITWKELMEKKTPNGLYFHFLSPASIQYKDSEVTEMFPHREAVFKALENSWNRNAPENMEFKLETEELKKHVIEKSYSHDTANTVVTRKQDGESKKQIKAFGFTGKTEYGFKNASDQLKKKLAILTRYAKHAGLGSHTARGLGNTYTEVRY
ncbi:CRISPR system precrRNA processing endoribonuclease RAMP protein Cas6 [Candidatus Nanohalococcus occultus]|uniref:CRISPR system precrRNA processing endoribonuclease RAMP protein Cas6 n=1 Tax=Candidatus Nanohalococcus occultus TaxID=2978047 RepID=UPI0039E1342F